MTDSSLKIKIPGYRLIRKVGEGGMSVVYLAFQESLKREVALKVMRPIITNEQDVVKRFEQEAEIIAKLYHPNIVNIYEVGHVDDDLLFYSMPYLQQGDLSSYAYHGDLELQEMVADICDGLSHAHNQGVIHRDIKPENILFDQFGNVQIADFGIALSTGQQRFTKDRKILGSVFYMSPEQANSKHIDARSDVYSLGAIIFELLTGEPVFDRDSDLSIMMAHLSDPVPQLPAEVAQWQQVINRCLAKSPNQRFQTMEDLKHAVLSINSKNSTFSFKSLLITAAVSVALIFGTWWLIERGSQEITNPTESSVNNSVSDKPIRETLPETLTVNKEQDQPVAEPPVLNLLSDAEIESLLIKAEANIKRKQLTTPKDDNALDDLLRLLRNVPNHPDGLNMLSEVMAAYYELLYQAVNKGNLSQAESFAESVAEVRHRTILTNEKLLTQLEKNTEMQRSLMVGAVVEKVQSAKSNLNQEKATRLISLVDQVIPGQDLVNELLDSIESMLKPGQVLTDSAGIKTTVVTPQFRSKRGLLNYGLAVTTSEITWSQFDRFADESKRDLSRCKSELKANLIFSQRNYLKPGFKTYTDMPVICVTWQDANAFANWLSKKTGYQYRLPTQQEWQHLNRLSETEFTCGQANLAGSEFPDKNDDLVLHACDDGSSHVAKVNKYPKNALGLRGMGGNVSEWLSGCKSLGKIKAIFNPDDPCDSNPAIGKSWISGATHKGDVEYINYDQAWTHIGFRLVRDLRNE